MAEPADAGSPMKPATLHTCRANRGVFTSLDFGDRESFDDAARGLLGSIPDARITSARGHLVWDMASFDFLDDERSPDSVNPSLWRHARLNRLHGLFEVTERVYQVRGFDLANMTIVEGDTGIVIIDPLMFTETAQAALALYRAHRGERPVRAVIYSHSHTDHYGGVEGVMTAAQAESGEVMVVAPDGFMHEAISENVLAGVPMRRRAMFQFGPTLPRGPLGHVDSGLGKVTGRGTQSLIAPNRIVVEPTETLWIDGVEIVCQLTPETEAPAEMNFFFPAFGVLNLSENGCHTMHNLCPIRGAKTRDALAWSKYLDRALDAFIDGTEVCIAQHHWPTWGRERVRRFITEQRDMYRYLHDQTLRLMSHGQTPNEIAESVELPPALAGRWHARPYYGAIAHNVRAIYTHYLGPYDGNPVNLNPLSPQAAARRYVEYMGGAPAVLERARRDFEAGDYRWVAQVCHHLVFADPSDLAARALCADALEQLGYQSESSTWRNAYLLGARELRLGAPKSPPGAQGGVAPRVVAMMPMPMFFDYLAIRVNGPKAADLALRIDWVMAGEAQPHRLTLSHGALSHGPGSHGSQAHALVRCDRSALAAILAAGKSFAQALDENLLRVEGEREAVAALFATLDAFSPMFAILEP